MAVGRAATLCGVEHRFIPGGKMHRIWVIANYGVWAIGGTRERKPVPMQPRHRRDWSRWGRYCICGLRWVCPDRSAPPVPQPYRSANRSRIWRRPSTHLGLPRNAGRTRVVVR